MAGIETMEITEEREAEKPSFVERCREGFESWWERNVVATMTQEQIDWYDTMKIIENRATSPHEKSLAIQWFNKNYPDRPIPIQ